MFKPVDANPNFPEMEKKWLKKWYESGLVKKYLKKNDNSDKYYSFLDGPITANNPMGVHHAWGRTYKDLWQKFYNLLGFKQRFQNGFDCQGLWVEVEVEKELGLKTKKDIENLVKGDKKASIAKFVQLCKDRVMKFAKIQTEQTKRLGNFMDWDNSYFTMSDQNNYMIWHFLKVCYDNGWVYKGRDSVPWCPRCETAISQHEMLTEDYKEAVHESVYFKLKIENANLAVEGDIFLLVWTTTPWTLPANIAVAVEESYEYSIVELKNGEKYILASELVKQVLGEDIKTVLKTVKGKELVGLRYSHVFDELPAVSQVKKENSDTFHIVVATDEQIMPITLTEGTGLVHTAVSAGTEDFQLGKKLGLPLIPVIADDASYLEGLGFLAGKNAKKHPELILDYMREKEAVYKTHQYKHRYPACWRCKTELVWKVADEWYIAMDKPIAKDQKNEGKTFRELMIEVTKKITWMPEFGLSRELDWLNNMHDWLISKKNRYWGLALPIYECKVCDRFEVIGSKDELKKKAVTGWEEFEDKSPHKPYIDDVKITCSKCGEIVSRIDDVGNPWLDAGIVPYSTISQNNEGTPLYTNDKKEWERWFPVNFITESFPGQFKNWFYALIAMSAALEAREPFERVLGFGTLLGEDGRPMHKSWGNSIEFNEGADKIGVDVMRFMYARQNPADNMLFGYKKADEVRRQFYLMLWNTYRFFVEYATLDKFTPTGEEKVTSENILDVWIIHRLHWLIEYVNRELTNYNVKDASAEMEAFVQDISTWFIRRSRDRVWVNSDNNEDKQYFYHTLHYVLVNLAIIMSPVMPFICEEIYTHLAPEKAESVHLSTWPDIKEKADSDILDDMILVREFVEAGHRERKQKGIKVRQILKKVTVAYHKENPFIKMNYSDKYFALIAAELNVKSVHIKKGEEMLVEYDLNLDDQLKNEGLAREVIRTLQQERKKAGLSPSQHIQSATVPDFPAEYEEMIKMKVMIKNKLNKGANVEIEV